MAMWSRNAIACVLTVTLLAAVPVYAQGNSGKGGGKGGGGDDGGSDGGGDTSPEVCQDRAAAFVYRTENSKGGEDIMLASSEGCSLTLLTSREYAVPERLAYHLDSASDEGIILWTERDPDLGWVAHEIWALRFSVDKESGALSVGDPQQLVSAFDNVPDPTYTRLPGDVRLDEDGSVYATLLHRDWIEVGESATSDIQLVKWASDEFPHGPVTVTLVPADLSLCYADDDCLDTADDNVSLRLDSPVFGLSAGAPESLFANFKLRGPSGDGFGGVLYWSNYGSDPDVLAYSVISSYSSGSDPRIASTSPVLPDAEILLRHFVSEPGRGEYYGSVVDVNCLMPVAVDGPDAWQQCLSDTDGRQIVGARFGAAWLKPGVIVHSMHARKSTDIYRYDIATGSSTRIITGGWFPVAAH
ncbi:hypothetical protein Q6D67_11290 [Haliea sp. E1-2-M8]|uniref:hypothetical protein n=1 Tax=Haliea sp. E1-2-M8 TaxID=3064706 RepID=UPI002722C212|nr:hypothetical protein [Haliea sp. E1-2-M8]MDO8862287.1 hypothetical protein [Haliea sp. E1-2-M8]